MNDLAHETAEGLMFEERLLLWAGVRIASADDGEEGGGAALLDVLVTLVFGCQRHPEWAQAVEHRYRDDMPDDAYAYIVDGADRMVRLASIHSESRVAPENS